MPSEAACRDVLVAASTTKLMQAGILWEDRPAAADKFWTEEPFAKNGGYQRDARIVPWVFGG